MFNSEGLSSIYIQLTHWDSEISEAAQATERESWIEIRSVLIQSPFFYRDMHSLPALKRKFLILYWGRAD